MKISNEIITSRQNKSVSLAASLDSRKVREREGLFRFDGSKLFEEALKNGVRLDRIFLKQSESEKWLSVAQGYGDKLADTAVLILSDMLFDRLSDERAPEGILSVAERPNIHVCEENDAVNKLSSLADDVEKRILLLESIRDTGNMGTSLRSASAFGVDLVVLSSDCADLFNPKTVRAAMGALFRQPTAVFSDITEAIGILRNRGRRVFGAALDREAQALGKSVLQKGDCVVIGNEGHGLSGAKLSACRDKLFIPMEPSSESLNAAVAASVILWSMYAEL
ncbi:MAG: RNA methyltransferase [Paludibacteraceae bacterium]|nr:RNA methyltransferase [Paludibacteraceae bacterium]